MKRPQGPISRAEPTWLRFSCGGVVWWSKIDRWCAVVQWHSCTCCAPGRYPCAHVQDGIKMKMPQMPGAGGEHPLPEQWSPSRVLKMMTCLNDFLCNPLWEEGTPRGERSLMLFTKVASVTAILKCETPPLKLVVSGANLDEALAALEASLMLPKCPFVLDDNPLGRAKGKRK